MSQLSRIYSTSQEEVLIPVSGVLATIEEKVASKPAFLLPVGGLLVTAKPVLLLHVPPPPSIFFLQSTTSHKVSLAFIISNLAVDLAMDSII